MTSALSELSQAGADFLAERHLATLSTSGPGGLIHVVAVGFTLADGVVRVITSDGSQKVRNVERDPRAGDPAAHDDDVVDPMVRRESGDGA